MVVKSAMSRRRSAVVAGLGLALLFVWSLRLFAPVDYAASTWQSAKDSMPDFMRPSSSSTGVQPHVEAYFQQVFSADHPPAFPYAALRDACARTKWRDDDVYLRCGGMSAGLTSIVSQVKVCLKMAVDAGANLVLPAMPLRDSTNLLDYNFLNGDAYLTYDQWFDADHLREVMGRACPEMKIVHPAQLGSEVAVRRTWSISCEAAWGYTKIKSYFWAGRPYRAFFESQYNLLEFKAASEPAQPESPTAAAAKTGITVVDVDSEFLLFRITDDPTRRDLRFWNDLSHVVRFTEKPRQIVDRLTQKITRPYYGVHFRVENDTIWSPLDNQLHVDLDALDRAWALYGRPGEQKPLVYLACGDKEQVEKFVAAGKERGWEVTHKWHLADAETRDMINSLAFDFQGAVDMGIMIRSEFFLGIAGSAFSSTIANQRDVTGRYRGSSFELEDEGARTHLFNDLDADEYARSL